MKGKSWYQELQNATQYDAKRFSKGGGLIDSHEKQIVTNFIDAIDGKKILDIACGTARFSLMLADLGADVVALDISEPMIEIGKNKLGQSPHSGDLTFLHADAGNLPFEDSSFDIILAMRFFHLTPIPMYFFLEMLRVAREKIIFDTFNKYSARSFYNWLLPMGSTLHDRSYIFRLLSSVDMTIEDSHQDFIFPYGIYRNLPLSIAKPIRSIDSSAVSTSIGQRVSTVSYWSVSL
jgi:ubiquinone/menaquinone biosynthesis C-methylase UbiE|tara:strand:+ start:771 stop:1475 length:705 start_codon:yes stop_codon:yes gene_type:complete